MRFVLALILLLIAVPVRAAGLELVMFDAPGCAYCAQWEEEVGDAYANTAEGRAAPLRRVSLRGPRPDDLTALKPVTFTPTFVLVRDGVELGRITGYAGEDFFWGFLNELLATHAPAAAAPGG